VGGIRALYAAHVVPPGGCWLPFEVAFEASRHPLHDSLRHVSLHGITEL